MKQATLMHLILGILTCLGSVLVNAEDPYMYFTWEVRYGTISPLGFSQQGILINGKFPGPTIDAVTNDNIIVNVINKLEEPFLITWYYLRTVVCKTGMASNREKLHGKMEFLGQTAQSRQTQIGHRSSKSRDQIGTYNYFPSTKLQRVAGGFGAFNIHQRSVISKPYPEPAADFTLLVHDWFKTKHKSLSRQLDANKPLPFPDALLINGQKNSAVFTGEKGKTYMIRVSNVGIATSINFRIQGHKMKLIEVEGAHTLQEVYQSLDVHVGQSLAVLVIFDQPPQDYYIVASSRFTKTMLTATATLRYVGSNKKASGPLPRGPTYQLDWSMKQARSIRLNLTANAARPNPQGSFHYGTIPVVRTIVLGNSKANINGKWRYAVNGISYVDPNTPLKLADWFNIPGVFNLNTIKNSPPRPGTPAKLGVSVVGLTLHDFVEIIFLNTETTVQSWHMDGSSFYTVGYGPGAWKPEMRRRYNLVDGVSRHTVQVYPNSWGAILLSLDNKAMHGLGVGEGRGGENGGKNLKGRKTFVGPTTNNFSLHFPSPPLPSPTPNQTKHKGMWNLRSAIWSRRYLGQELYLTVWNNEKSLFTEYDPPPNLLFCGKAKHLH